jgi:hypothetical protein
MCDLFATLLLMDVAKWRCKWPICGQISERRAYKTDNMLEIRKKLEYYLLVASQ